MKKTLKTLKERPVENVMKIQKTITTKKAMKNLKILRTTKKMKTMKTQAKKNLKTQKMKTEQSYKRKGCFINKRHKMDIFSDIQVNKREYESMWKTNHDIFDKIESTKDISWDKVEKTGRDRSLEDDILDNLLFNAEREERKTG